MTLPLRVLLAAPCPNNLHRVDSEQLTQITIAALSPFIQCGKLFVDRVLPATEATLRSMFEKSEWNILHFTGHVQERSAAQYSSIIFERSDGESRGLTLPYFAQLVKAHSSLQLVIIQNVPECGNDSSSIAAALVEYGVPGVMTISGLPGHSRKIFAATLYSALCTTGNVESAMMEARTALDSAGLSSCTVSLSQMKSGKLVLETQTASAEDQAAGGAARTFDQGPSEKAVIIEDIAAKQVAAKRSASSFDVFLCHSSGDKPEVKRIGEQLLRRGILPWLDEWELRPGHPWHSLVEEQIGSCKAAAVFVGAAGVGPWQEQEVYAFLREFVERRLPVIPVLLREAPHSPTLPRFLRGNSWVDFREIDPDPLSRLIWGITGTRPGD